MQRQATPKFFSAAGKHTRKKRDRLKNFCIDCYPYGMPMPGRSVYGNYRYGFQGEFAETDSETAMPAFELRLWDARIGRWLTTDPYGEFFSPYLGMGNNPISLTDPDGGQTGCPNCINLDNVDLTASASENTFNYLSSIFDDFIGEVEKAMERFQNKFKDGFNDFSPDGIELYGDVDVSKQSVGVVGIGSVFGDSQGNYGGAFTSGGGLDAGGRETSGEGGVNYFWSTKEGSDELELIDFQGDETTTSITFPFRRVGFSINYIKADKYRGVGFGITQKDIGISVEVTNTRLLHPGGIKN